MQLQPNRVSTKAVAGQACPVDSVLALLDVLLCRAALIVEGHHPLGRSAPIEPMKPSPNDALDQTRRLATSAVAAARWARGSPLTW